jgi:hypothetical protein
MRWVSEEDPCDLPRDEALYLFFARLMLIQRLGVRISIDR